MKLLFMDSLFSGNIAKAISWMLIHSLWLGLIAAIFAGIVIISTGRSNPRLRYNLLCSLFAVYLFSVVITFIIQVNVAEEKLPIFSAVPAISSVSESGNSVSTIAPGKINAENFIDRFVAYFNANASMVVLIWAIFFIGKSIKLFGGIYYTHRIKTLKVRQPDRSWREKILKLSNILGIKQQVTLLESGIIKVPMAVGLLKATILVPIGLLNNMPADQVESILVHELAHIKRRDYLVNMMQGLVETVFFFNPAILWISSLIHEEREACCDDIVINHLPQKNSYLEALVSFHEYNFTSTKYVMAFAGRRNFLLGRVHRLITNENKKLNIPEKLVLILGLSVLMAFGLISGNNQPDTESKKQGANLSDKQKTITDSMGIYNIPKQEPILQPALMYDTVPQKKKLSISTTSKYHFPSISATINNSEHVKEYDVTARDSKGISYRVKKYNDQLTELVINGAYVPKEEFGNYQHLVDAIEESRLAALKKNPHYIPAHQPSHAKAKPNPENKAFPESEPTTLGKLDRLDSSPLNKPDMYKPKSILLNNKIRLKDNWYIQNIIKDLNHDMSKPGEDITSETNNLSFTLNKNEMIVNGQKQNSEVHKKYKSRYIKNAKDYFIYFHENGTTGTTVYVE